jgi:hypothetical protein
MMVVAESPDDMLLAEAVLRTVLYADVFQFPLTDAEIHHFLIGQPAPFAAVAHCLSNSRWLAARIECGSGYWSLQGGVSIREQRLIREQSSVSLWPEAIRYGQRLAHVPYVRMVAITGALAVHNAHTSGDDIDYLLVTSPRRVWLARLMVIALVRIARQRGIKLCPNYVLSTAALAQDRRDLYIAHEMAQMIPLSGWTVYKALRSANAWTDSFLPNATSPFYSEPDRKPYGVGQVVQQFGEWLLNGEPGHRLEAWEQRRKQRKFATDAQLPHASAQLDADRVKGHFKDYGYLTLQRYHQRLQVYQLDQ